MQHAPNCPVAHSVRGSVSRLGVRSEHDHGGHATPDGGTGEANLTSPPNRGIIQSQLYVAGFAYVQTPKRPPAGQARPPDPQGPRPLRTAARLRDRTADS